MWVAQLCRNNEHGFFAFVEHQARAGLLKVSVHPAQRPVADGHVAAFFAFALVDEQHVC